MAQQNMDATITCRTNKVALDVTIIDEVPTFEITASMDGWTPFRPVLTIELNGLSRTDSLIVLSGLDTELKRNLSLLLRYQLRQS